MIEKKNEEGVIKTNLYTNIPSLLPVPRPRTDIALELHKETESDLSQPGPRTPNAARQLYILLHDSDSFGMYCAEIRVLK